tara:strand:+ start:777 stop:911 length:135 start_codon:yes stop_codon:yes gene_type:complete
MGAGRRKEEVMRRGSGKKRASEYAWLRKADIISEDTCACARAEE